MDVNSPAVISRQIATGLLSLFRETGEMQLGIPYPVTLQRGFDRLTWYSQQQATVAPQSIAELLRWCNQPLMEWPSFKGAGVPDWADADALLYNDRPTYFCDELHCPGLNVVDELMQNGAFQVMITDCRERQDQQAYVTFRQFLIEHPIIDIKQLLDKRFLFRSETIRLLLDDSYERIPDTYAVDGMLNCCGICGYVMQRKPDGGYHCENEVCRRSHPSKAVVTLNYSDSIRRLKRPFRRFITYPGIAELQLADKLHRKGLVVQLWPQFDCYDIHLTLPDGTSWAIDVKDWSNPFSLGTAINQETFPAAAQYDRFLFVIPNHRTSSPPDYIRAVKSRCTPILNQADILSESQLIRQVNQHLKKQ